jgi:hypothetical protein
MDQAMVPVRISSMKMAMESMTTAQAMDLAHRMAPAIRMALEEAEEMAGVAAILTARTSLMKMAMESMITAPMVETSHRMGLV